MRKFLSLLIVIIIIFSCEEKDVVKEYYPNGMLKVKVEVDKEGIQNGLYEGYYDTGEIEQKMNYVNGKIVDTVFYYHKNGKVREEGVLYNNDLKIDWWSFYDSHGVLKNKSEY